MSGNVFVCYASSDKTIAEDVCSQLETRGIACWIAPRDILPSMPWSAAIIQAISNCSAMVFILSEHSNDSPHVMRELEAAVKRDVSIMPFRVDGVTPSGAVEYFVTSNQYLDALPTPEEQHYDRLANSLKKIMASDQGCKSGMAGRHKLASQDENVQIPEGSEPSAYEAALIAAEDMLKDGKWTLCIRQCGALFEKGLRQSLTTLIPKIRDQESASKIREEIEKMGGDGITPETFDFEQLCSVYREAKVFDELRKHVTSTLHYVKTMPWQDLLVWQKATKSGENTVGESEARDMAYLVKRMLYECELAGAMPRDLGGSGSDRPSVCDNCDEEMEPSWDFCPYCGIPIHLQCRACELTLEADWKICPRCETPAPRRGSIGNSFDANAEQEYRTICLGAYLDGVVNYREKVMMEKKRLELGLSTEEADRIERDCAPPAVVDYNCLVEGVLVDGVINEAERVFLDAKAKQLGVDRWVAHQIEEAVLAMAKKDQTENPSRESSESDSLREALSG